MSTPSSRVIAAFDLDGTLTEGGSVFRWLRAVGGNAVAYRAALVRTFPLAWGVLRSGTAADEAKESLFTGVLSGRSLSEVQAQSRVFAAAHLERRGRAVTLARLRWHLDHGHTVVLVSASPEIYVGEIAHALGAHGFVGTRLAVDPLGRLTGGYLGHNCRGEEKLRRLHEWMADNDVSADTEVYAYGNSRGDRRLLAGAAHPYDVGKLGRFGALRAYPRLTTDPAL